MLNKSAYAELKNEDKAKADIEAVLLEYDIDGKKDKPAWRFLVNPSSLRFSDAAEYDNISPIASSVRHKSYSNATGRTLTIDKILMDCWYQGKNLMPVIEGARALLRAKVDQNQYAPLVLCFSFGTKRFKPCVLMKLDWTESRFLSGNPGRIEMGMVLEEIPAPPTKAELEAKEKKKQDAIADRREKAGKPRIDLTKRQQENAIAAAREYLLKNRDQFSAEVQGFINLKTYDLTVDPESGDVEMKVGTKKVGTVLRSLGEKAIANKNITTIPLKEGGKLPELK